MISSQQFRKVPHVIRDARFHRRRDADRTVNAAEVVEREIQAVRGPEALPLFREPIREPGQSAHVHADRQVQASSRMIVFRSVSAMRSVKRMLLPSSSSRNARMIRSWER
jgi:hypothetical protein